MAKILTDSVTPQIEMATTYTKQDLNDPQIVLNTHDSILLMKYPYKEKFIDSIAFILFLSTLKEDDFNFDLTTGLCRKIDGNEFDCRLLISEKSITDGLNKLIFKIEFDSLGNYIYIQIMGTSNHTEYELIRFKTLI